MAAVFEAASGGDHARARELDELLQPVYAAFSKAPPASSVKAALELQGVIGGTLRLPMVPVSDAQRTAIQGELESRGLLRTDEAAA